MKEDINIDKLFQDKFKNFEGNVDPSAWANISQGIGAGASGGASGLTGLAKVAIIVGAATITTLGVWYFSPDSEKKELVENDIQNDELVLPLYEDTTFTIGEIIAEDTNDPVIQGNVNQIHEDFTDIQMSPGDFDQDLIDLVLSHENAIIEEENAVGNDNQNNNNAGNDQNSINKEDVDPIISINPEARPVKAKLQTELDNNTLTFVSGAKNHTLVEWEFGDGSTGTGEYGSHEYDRPGSYTLKMAVHGEAETVVSIEEIIIEGTSSIGNFPNIITPNGDGHNDYLMLECNDLTSFQITIYDMNGKVVFSSNDPAFEWNGELPDGLVEEGNYVYQIYAVGEDGAIYEDGRVVQVKKQ